jgi:hypothetical protein
MAFLPGAPRLPASPRIDADWLNCQDESDNISSRPDNAGRHTSSTDEREEHMEIGMIQPTFEGVLRYPPDGYLTAEMLGEFVTVPCVCESSCPHPCIGHCGCEACALYRAFLDKPSYGESVEPEHAWDPFVSET